MLAFVGYHLPSFGSAPGLTSSTLPPSFITARNVAAISSRNAASNPAVGDQRHRNHLVFAGDDEAQAPERGMALADLGDLPGAYEHAIDLGSLVGATLQPSMRMLGRETPGARERRVAKSPRLAGRNAGPQAESRLIARFTLPSVPLEGLPGGMHECM
ncbi:MULTISPECIES: hypothetical protein [unclassified Bradyrhizobium]